MVRTSPLEAILRGSGATMLYEAGVTFANDFGSVAGEVAVCLRAVGIADRSDLVKLDISGPAEDVAAVVGSWPAPCRNPASRFMCSAPGGRASTPSACSCSSTSPSATR